MKVKLNLGFWYDLSTRERELAEALVLAMKAHDSYCHTEKTIKEGALADFIEECHSVDFEDEIELSYISTPF